MDKPHTWQGGAEPVSQLSPALKSLELYIRNSCIQGSFVLGIYDLPRTFRGKTADPIEGHFLLLCSVD